MTRPAPDRAAALVEGIHAGDRRALARAITATIAETDIMALQFRLTGDGLPVQRVVPEARPALRRIDLSDRTDARDHAFALMQADVDAALAAGRTVLADTVRRYHLSRGTKRGELSWILEDNLPMRRLIELVGAKPYKTYRIYEKSIG